MASKDSNLFNVTLPSSQQSIIWHNLLGNSQGLLLAQAAQQFNGLLLVITTDMASLYGLQSELKFYVDDQIPILSFPDWETLPYDMFSPYQDIISQRLATLYHLPLLQRGILIVPVSTLMQYITPRDYLVGNSLVMAIGDVIDLDDMRKNLEAGAYQCVNQVMSHGEFAIRGSILDVYPMGSDYPYRIDLFDLEVDSIRTFDPDTQRTLEKIDHIKLLPAREFPFTEEAINGFRQRYRSQFPNNLQDSAIYRDISKGLIFGGIEYYLPLFFQQTETLFSYFPKNTLLATVGDIEQSVIDFSTQLTERFEQRAHDRERPILLPEQLYLSLTELQQHIAGLPRIILQQSSVPQGIGFPVMEPPTLLIDQRAEHPAAKLQAFIADYSGRVLFAAESSGRREALMLLLNSAKIKVTEYQAWSQFLASDSKIGITVSPLESGLLLENPAIAVIAEAQLFGQQVLQQRRRKKSVTVDAENIISNLTDLHIDDPVVHREHGVGRYRGLQNLDMDGVTIEFLILEYAKDNKLYVPTTSLDLISRYTGASPENAPLHQLGSEKWQKLRKKAAERVRDVAAELLAIHAKRAARDGFAFPTPDNDYTAFANEFPFVETEDQAAAIINVIKDMTSPHPMDRVVCGDVGFGKTEVALRAAFIATQGNRQVVMLVPTTLLAQQHYQTFCDRFADWPVKIDVLSRFRTKKQTEAGLKALADGTIDIMVGTHKLLQDNIKFKSLGLVIIDEEHRFGVRQKERLKALRAEVDLLTLTATPIPRTLNMAMSGMRDLSIIATPPAHRHAIKTFVTEWNNTLISEACLREIKRGGQVYFLHNRVESIERIAAELSELIPEATVQVAHGQMREQALEQVMLDFYHQRFNILVCTTIVESGIDLPSANTIIIDRADKLGLAQLHQLRGRVGRSHHRAYAYLVVPPKENISRDAVKRLAAIESLENLGAGFTLSTHDLEIRGAGELLGDDQSGQIQEIGFSLYSELLERAVNALKSGQDIDLIETEEHDGTEVDLHISALIPADYIYDVHTRLVFYKRIANADKSGLDELQVELIDRFGLLPDALKHLFSVTELKLIASHLGIKKIDVHAAHGRILFDSKPNIDPLKIIQMIQTQPHLYQLDGTDKLKFTLEADNATQKIAAVETILAALQAE